MKRKHVPAFSSDTSDPEKTRKLVEEFFKEAYDNLMNYGRDGSSHTVN